MKPAKKHRKTLGVVVETSDYGKTYLIVVARAHNMKRHFFFFVKRTPEIVPGDIVQLTLSEKGLSVIRHFSSTPFTKFEVTLVPWPGTLLMETMSERMNL